MAEWGSTPVHECPGRKYGFGANEWFGYCYKGEDKYSLSRETPPKREGTIPRPSNMVYLGDFYHIYSAELVYPESQKKGFLYGRIWEVHNVGGNYMYIDGHVRWTLAKQVVPSMFDWTWKP